MKQPVRISAESIGIGQNTRTSIGRKAQTEPSTTKTKRQTRTINTNIKDNGRRIENKIASASDESSRHTTNDFDSDRLALRLT